MSTTPTTAPYLGGLLIDPPTNWAKWGADDEGDWDDGGKGHAYPGGLHYADDKLNAYLQGSTQYDARGHLWYEGDDKLWNGFDARTTIGGLDKASVEPIAQRRVVRRVVCSTWPVFDLGPPRLKWPKAAARRSTWSSSSRRLS